VRISEELRINSEDLKNAIEDLRIISERLTISRGGLKILNDELRNTYEDQEILPKI
jgi:hypothetical protein